MRIGVRSHGRFRKCLLHVGGAECLQKKILLLVPDLLVAGRRYWLGSGRFSVLLAEQGCDYGVGLQKEVLFNRVFPLSDPLIAKNTFSDNSQSYVHILTHKAGGSQRASTKENTLRTLRELFFRM